LVLSINDSLEGWGFTERTRFIAQTNDTAATDVMTTAYDQVGIIQEELKTYRALEL
jgi:hypothetical protein